ncbi:MAG: DUF4974 domain-containing protein [Bacteroidaceae bacterium]|nr:DUF4974 domain-containing protein [Bacteroidaceae bacterium]
MKKEQKTDVLLQMMEQPEQYTEQQWLDILSDEECRGLYTMIALTQGAVDAARAEAPLTLPHRARKVPVYRKIAAIFLVAAFLGSLAWAIGVPILTFPKDEKKQSAQVTSTPLTIGGGREGAPVRFSNVRLDSILTVVARHYGKAVRYSSEEPRAMKLITTWNPVDSLSAFIKHLNMFDYLHLTLQGDTIFVESVEEEVAQ